MRKVIFIYCVLFFSVKLCFSQESPHSRWPKDDQKTFETAKILMDEKIYSVAYDRFNSLLKKYPDETYLKYLLGICGFYVRDKHS